MYAIWLTGYPNTLNTVDIELKTYVGKWLMSLHE